MNSQAVVLQKRRSVSKPWRIAFWVLIGLVALFLVAYFGIGTAAAMQLSAPKRTFDPNGVNPSQFNLQYEAVTYPSRGDQTQIAAWYIPTVKNSRAIVLVHGRDNSRTDAFKGRFVEFGAALQKAGYSVLMIELRGHGQSGPGRFTFGIKERWDVEGGVDWLLGKGYQPGKIAVLGYSLGAGSVIGAAAEEKAVGAVVTEAAYADIAPVIKKNWAEQSGLPMMFLTPTTWMIQLLYGYDVMASRPVDEVSKIAPRPMLMIHCTTDEMIAYTNLGQLQAQIPSAQTWTIDGCRHGFAYNFGPVEYTQQVVNFLNASIQE